MAIDYDKVTFEVGEQFHETGGRSVAILRDRIDYLSRGNPSFDELKKGLEKEVASTFRKFDPYYGVLAIYIRVNSLGLERVHQALDDLREGKPVKLEDALK